MRAKELIKLLQNIVEQYGDMETIIYTGEEIKYVYEDSSYVVIS